VAGSDWQIELTHGRLNVQSLPAQQGSPGRPQLADLHCPVEESQPFEQDLDESTAAHPFVDLQVTDVLPSQYVPLVLPSALQTLLAHSQFPDWHVLPLAQLTHSPADGNSQLLPTQLSIVQGLPSLQALLKLLLPQLSML